jgi:hypothetical protein
MLLFHSPSHPHFYSTRENALSLALMHWQEVYPLGTEVPIQDDGINIDIGGLEGEAVSVNTITAQGELCVFQSHRKNEKTCVNHVPYCSYGTV